MSQKDDSVSISGSEVARHNTKDSCWLAVRGRVYDVTNFLDEHPGGARVILNCAGRDATDEYDAIHPAELIEETLPSSAFQGAVDPSTLSNRNLPKPAQQDPTKTSASAGPPPLSTLLNLRDFEQIAEKYLPANAWAYYTAGADDEYSKAEAELAYRKVLLRPRILRNVGNIDTSTKILGCDVSLPVYMSAVGIAKFAHPQGECTLAAVAGREGLAQLVATRSSMSLQSIMQARTGGDQQPIFFQLYMHKYQKISETTILKAVNSGIKGIWLTVDSPVTGKRERDERLKAEVDVGEQNKQLSGKSQPVQGIAKTLSSTVSPYLDWNTIAWIRSLTSLPLVIKGIQCVEDAVLAYQHNVDGIVLSNHGGRSQDTAQAPLLTLLEINKYAPIIMKTKKMQIFIDGGIRRGTDVIKALALGATAVGLGRPFLYSMSAGYGEAGTRRMIEILREEIEMNMALAGATKISELEMGMLNTARLERDLTTLARL
ncbi:putative oxidoreductase [Talaromyces proteolyticus]|uniref:L-lactate dehydrogenase (cytochrome) n=1 Tax=Talaromyces proteolyticus TaxID=1131652 RepID=A0AAD4KGJ2_9EURO|nr:putative oxidoreductase [Talaromyces proteolyticus]KAH8690588.1 putative oxidoreductase [Talaromyces proteolyticus]